MLKARARSLRMSWPSEWDIGNGNAEKNGFVEIAKAELPESFLIMAANPKFYWLSLRSALPVRQEKPIIFFGPLTRTSNL